MKIEIPKEYKMVECIVKMKEDKTKEEKDWENYYDNWYPGKPYREYN